LYPYRYNIQAKKQQIEDWFSVSATLPSRTHFAELQAFAAARGRADEMKRMSR